MIYLYVEVQNGARVLRLDAEGLQFQATLSANTTESQAEDIAKNTASLLSTSVVRVKSTK